MALDVEAFNEAVDEGDEDALYLIFAQINSEMGATDPASDSEETFRAIARAIIAAAA